MRLVLYLIALALAPTAVAQTQLNARVGLNVATVTGEFATADDAGVRYGFVGGLSLAFPLRYSLVLHVEALYAQKGFNTDEATIRGADGTPIAATAVTFEVTTVDVPVLLAYRVPLARDVGVAVYGGPYVGIELSERLRFEQDVAGASRETDLFEGTDIGIVLGVDVNFALKGVRPSLGVRYARSVADGLEEIASAVPGAAAFNSVVSVFVGVRL